jgi:hypothetical protein
MKRLLIFLLITFILTIHGIFFIFGKNTILSLTHEDGLIENFGALSLLGASICFLICFLRDKRGNDFFIRKFKKNIFFILLAILMFFGFGEEISWGQRIFNFKTPKKIEMINMQKELTMHNIYIFEGKNKEGEFKWYLKIFKFNFLFVIFSFSFGILIPFLNKKSLLFRQFFEKINIPIVPLWLGIFFLTNYVSLKIFEFFLVYQYLPSDPLNVCREKIFEFTYLLISIYFLNSKSNEKIA